MRITNENRAFQCRYHLEVQKVLQNDTTRKHGPAKIYVLSTSLLHDMVFIFSFHNTWQEYSPNKGMKIKIKLLLYLLSFVVVYANSDVHNDEK